MNNEGDWRRLEALRALGYKVTCPIPGGAREIAAEIRASKSQARAREYCRAHVVARYV